MHHHPARLRWWQWRRRCVCGPVWPCLDVRIAQAQPARPARGVAAVWAGPTRPLPTVGRSGPLLTRAARWRAEQGGSA
jgi:hypothetical protein